jgi:RNA polymerase sigma factor (TIGR02999 family)
LIGTPPVRAEAFPVGNATNRAETRHGDERGPLTFGRAGGKIGHPMTNEAPTPDITALLRAWTAGNQAAGDRLMPLVYRELRRRAAACLRRERPDHTLTATALVHETYLRLVDQREIEWQNRVQFLAIASQMMRRILIDQARRRRMQKRSGRWTRVSLEDCAAATEAGFDVVLLDSLLVRLDAFDPRKSRVVELRYFGGLSLEEIAGVLGVSAATVDREWRAARAWLHAQLTNGS